jgi:hypothetical protein
MPLLDLSQTTLALKKLLEVNIPLLEPGLLGSLTISTLPPERTSGADHVLSLYCYHISPDPANRVRMRQSSGQRPIATSPLTLILNYILTAHTFTGSDYNALTEQRLLGYAMKTLHDYPVIDDATRVGGQIIMPDEIRGLDNRFSVTQLHLTAGEALNYWASETQTTAKPSCYYEVNSAEIQAEPPDRLPGIVLRLGAHVFPKSAPVLAESQSQVPFTNPASAGGGAVSLTASPARIGPVTGAPPPANVLRLVGTGLAGGDERRLLLAHPFWVRNFPGGTVPLDMALNGALGWAQTIEDDDASIVCGNILRADPPDGGATVNFELYPGLYAASWETAQTFTRDGATEWVRERSNTVAVMVYPRIIGSTRNNVTGAVKLNLGGAWLLTRGRPIPIDPTLAPELAIDLSVDARAYRLVNGAVPAVPGTFTIAAHDLTYLPHPEQDVSGDHSIRLIVDGADAQPFWVAIP